MKYRNILVLSLMLVIFVLFSCDQPGTVEPEVSQEKQQIALYKTSDSAEKHAKYADHFLVEYNGSLQQLNEAVENLDGTVERVHPEVGFAKITGISADQVGQLNNAQGIKNVMRDLLVQWVPALEATFETLQVPAGTETHNNPTDALLFGLQWNMIQVNAPAAWQIEQGVPSVRVAILDTGISPTHVDLVGRYDLAASTSFVASEPTVEDENFHGTFVSGIVSANNIGIAGMAPHITMVGVKVLNKFGVGTFADVIAGILYATDVADVDIINMSLGAYFPKSSAGSLIGMLSKAVNHANTNGILVVASAGGNASDLDHDADFIHVPSQSGSATSVNATGPLDNLASYSNFGVTGVNVAAPGGNFGDLPTPTFGLVIGPAAPAVVGGNTSSYFLASGTSFSTPIATGIAALIDSRHNGSLNGGQLRTKIEQSSDDLGAPGVDENYGHGRVNAFKAVQQ